MMSPKNDDTRTSSGDGQEKDHVYKLLEKVCESSIFEADLTDAIDNLTQLYASFSSQGFETSFEHILMLTVNESRRSKDVEKIFRLVSDFAVSLDNKYKAEHAKNKKSDEEEEEDDDDCIHPFLEYLFDLLPKWSRSPSWVIRSRSCQLLYIILANVLDSGAGEIDAGTYEKIADLTQVRHKDNSANVRAHAVMLAKFFQDPSDHEDPVISALCWQLQADPNQRVRQNILEIIAACEETLTPVTRRFLHDKNSAVRNSALLHICHRISPRSYTTEFRILILNQCFQDASAAVRRNAEQKLIPMWFRTYGDKLCVFFKNLRLGNDCLDKLPFARRLIQTLFRLVKVSQILEEIDLDPETALPKSSLNGEQFFIWDNFYSLASQQPEKFKKFIPQPEALVDYITKQFQEVSFDESCAYNELISFTMNVIDIMGEDKCETLPPLAIDVLKNVFIPRDVISYAVTMYCEYASKETKDIHDDILQTITNLMKFVELSGEEQKEILLKCLVIFSELLAQDNVSASVNVMGVKDELVLANIDSDDVDIKREALRALSLYCLLDLDEARQFWPYMEKTIYESSDSLKLEVMKGTLDIFKCHGCKVVGEFNDDTIKQFEEILNSLLLHAVDAELDLKIILKGMFKLYLSHHTYSPILLAKLIMLMFDPEGNIIKNKVVSFLELYGESSEEAECLTRSFLVIINQLFSSEKSSFYHQISIKTAVTQLLEFAKLYEENKNFEVQDHFRDLLVVRLTKKFIKKPWRLPVSDLEDICSSIMPRNIDTLIKLQESVAIIIECLQSTKYQKKNPFTKKSINFFTKYLKKIETAIHNVQDGEINSSQRLSVSTPGSNFLSKVISEPEPVSPMLHEQEVSF